MARQLFALITILIASAQARPALAFEKSFWAWQRSSPLSPEETGLIREVGVSRIYWHIGELVNTGNDWHWNSRFPLPTSDDLRFVPVVRLISNEQHPFNERSLDRLCSVLDCGAQSNHPIQFDYDCPDRLIPEYANALKSLQYPGSITITGLPHWAGNGALQSFHGCVDAIFPMFYDFQSEPVLPNDGPRPLLDPAKMNQMLQEWSSCPLPWYAGLPNFSRLTAYDGSGKSRGHIRNWTWDEIMFQPGLINEAETKAGVFILRATRSLRISKAELHNGDRLVVRLTRPELLEQSSAAAEKAGAQGVVFFRLPEGSVAADGCSIRQLSQLESKAELTVTKGSSGSSLIVTNKGAGDLFPSLESSGTGRGYWLEISTDNPIFREAEPGEFAPVTRASDGAGGRKVPVPFARGISFGFSNLAAGQKLETGLIQLAPGISFNQTRYRIQPIQHEWKPLD